MPWEPGAGTGHVCYWQGGRVITGLGPGHWRFCRDYQRAVTPGSEDPTRGMAATEKINRVRVKGLADQRKTAAADCLESPGFSLKAKYFPKKS